jgi:hypothetical protein
MSLCTVCQSILRRGRGDKDNSNYTAVALVHQTQCRFLVMERSRYRFEEDYDMRFTDHDGMDRLNACS